MNAATLKTGSLRLRTVVAVLIMLVVLLGAVGVTIQLVLGDRLRVQIEERLTDRASAAASLIGTVDSEDLARRLSVQGLSVRIRAPDGSSVVAGPTPNELRKGTNGGDLKGAAPRARQPAPAASPALTAGTTVTIASAKISADEQVVTLVSRLSDGSTLTLATDASSITDTLAQLRLLMILAGVAFLVVAALCLVFVVRTTLRPLDRMTEVARSISAGDRGRRLNPRNRETEIGRVALAFDEMLDTVEGAERTALDAEIKVRAFVSDAAHELRTPVTGMLAAAEALVRNPETSEESERLASHIAREANRASRLVDNLLLMARLDRGLELEKRPVDLVAHLRADAERQALRHPLLEIVLDLPTAPLTVEVDFDRITQVVNNLVDNAAHSTAGAGRVVISLREGASSADIVVKDSGPGVAEPDRERIFDRFVRLDASRRESASGAGLGLPIARGIAEAHGGTLTCGGAVFTVTLPMRAQT